MNHHLSAINSVRPRIENFNASRPAIQPLQSEPSFRSALDQFSLFPSARISAVGGSGVTDEARTAAAQFVGMAFIQPLLAQMRESSIAEGPFAPTTAEKRFGPLMDQMLSDRITLAADFPLVDAVARQITSTGIYAENPRGDQSHD